MREGDSERGDERRGRKTLTASEGSRDLGKWKAHENSSHNSEQDADIQTDTVHDLQMEARFGKLLKRLTTTVRSTF